MAVSPYLLSELIEHFGRRPFAELNNEFGQFIDLTFSVILNGSVTSTNIHIRENSAGSYASGHVKLLLKPRSELGKFNVSAECIVSGLFPGTGFSGFSMAGKISTSDEQASVDVRARTNRYNVWNWGNEFQF